MTGLALFFLEGCCLAQPADAAGHTPDQFCLLRSHYSPVLKIWVLLREC